MCDALSRNTPKASGVEILLANCLAHGRRQFVEIAPNFPEECRYVLESLGAVYYNDAMAREQALSAEDRLRLHQQQSGPVMEQLHAWLEAQLAEKKTEPNSGLGKAITYLLRHWKGLTAFLRHAGAPLDNNICEQALKRAVLHRKNALFYKTLNGAQVGDLFMSLIHTCELNGANSFDYLTELQRHARELAAHPAEWMPWNYRDDAGRVISWFGRMAESNSLKPCGSDTLEMAAKRASENSKIDRGFLASDRNRRKCFASGCMRGCPRTTSRLCRCRCAPCGSMRRSAAGRSRFRSKRSVPARPSVNSARNCWLRRAAARSMWCWSGDWIAGAGHSSIWSSR